MPAKRLNDGQKEFLKQLLNYFKKEFERDGALLPLSSVYIHQRVSEALGISVRTVRRVVHEQQVTVTQPEEEADDVQPAEGYASTSTPSTNRQYPYHPRKKWKRLDLPAAVKMDVRKKIYDLVAKRQHVTVDTFRGELADRQVLNISSTSLRRLLRELGFKYSKDNNRRALMEQRSVVVRRAQFLHGFRENQRAQFSRQVVFLDETWVFAKGGTKRTWHAADVRSARRGTSSVGKRFIVLHSGTEDGHGPYVGTHYQ